MIASVSASGASASFFEAAAFRRLLGAAAGDGVLRRRLLAGRVPRRGLGRVERGRASPRRRRASAAASPVRAIIRRWPRHPRP